MSQSHSLQKSLQKKSAFTLIEVLVASILLSGVFFALLTLLSSNTRQVANLRDSEMMDELFLASKACIQSFGYNTLSWVTATQSLNFGTDNLGCFTGSYNPDLSFSGISLERTSGTETLSTTFWNYFRVESQTGTLKVYNTLESETEKKEYSFMVGPEL